MNTPENDSPAATQVPVLNLEAYLAGEAGALDVLARELYAACTGIGFF